MSIEIKSLSQLVQDAYIEKKTGITSQALMNYKSLGMNETVNSEGAYCVTAQLASEILASTQQAAVCYSKAKIINVSKGKSVKLPYVEEAFHSNVTANILTAYWPGEGKQKTISHPCFGQLDLPLNTLAILCPITDELMEDSQQLEGFLKSFVPIKIAQAIDKRMIYGNPASSMFGITFNNAIGVIGVANADPITLANMIAYEKALCSTNKANAEWYMGTEQYNELLDLIDDTKTNTGYKWEEDGLYVFGHKVNVCEYLVKNEYDLILGDFSQYVVVQRGLQQVISIGFKFNLDEKVIRWTIRINGASFGQKVVLEDGSIVAPFVIPLEGPVDMSSSSSSNTESSESSASYSSDTSQSETSEEQTSHSSESLVSISSASSPSTSSASSMSESISSMSNSSSSSSKSLSSASSMSLSSASSMSLSSASSMSNSSMSLSSVSESSQNFSGSSSSKSDSSMSESISSESSSSESLSSESSSSLSSDDLQGCLKYYCASFIDQGESGTYIATGTLYNSKPTYFNGTYYIWFDTASGYWAMSGDVGDPQNQWVSSRDDAGECPYGTWVLDNGTIVAGKCQ